MSHILYHKLVRDRVPEMIMERGWRCQVVELQQDEYLSMLDKKLQEEMDEYKQNKSLEELADMLEVIHAIAQARGSSMAEVENIRSQKAQKRGGFKGKLLLREVWD